jgi:zinc D-Ala-D-Ala carboxypeptidase
MGWKYFSEDEMRCKCGCGQVPMDSHFMDMLDSLRAAVGRPLLVSSGYRCSKHDKGEKGEGNHTQGKAVDIACPDSTLRFAIIRQAILLGFKRIGIHRDFLHLDMVSDSEHPNNVLWLY